MPTLIRLAVGFVLIGSGSISWGAPVDFPREVQPLLTKSCVACHGPDKQRGGLRLDRKADALKGGDGGAVIVPGKGAESLLVRLVAGEEPDRTMPPKGDRLTVDQIAVLRRWIDEGAKWPEDGSANVNPLDWWSLRPLQRPAIPDLAIEDRAWGRNPIDAFIVSKLRAKGLKPSPEADRRTLIRRVTFDLLGLPPTPEEITQFANDLAPDAYERLVDRLLASPHYGERWGRHWLDIVHYGDTHGYDKDQPRPNAWPYRDYVIRSFNADKPYARFIQEQVAGDELFPNTRDGITAMGFIAAGPWDLIGHAEVPESKIDGKIARHLDRDDMVANTMNTFVSLTVQCAQCHNHKFDPIAQEDYYRLHAVFAALDRADRPYPTSPEAAQRAEALTVRRDQMRRQIDEMMLGIRKAGGDELATLDQRITMASKPVQPRAEYGYHSGIEAKPDREKWVQLDLGRRTDIARLVLYGCYDDFNSIGAGFGFPVRYRVQVSDDPTFATSATVVDRTMSDAPNPGTSPQSFPVKERSGRYVRITATKLAPRMNDYIFALAECEVFDGMGKNVANGATITALDSIEAAPRWRKSNLVDGYAPGQGGELAELVQSRQRLLEKLTSPVILQRMQSLEAELAAVEAELKSTQPTSRVYAGTIHSGSGAFRGTGPDGGKPRPIAILRRGEVTKPGKEVGPGTLTVIPELPGSFQLPPNHREGERRVQLARWLSDARNPLTWRSIVNRTWQYHFGRGIVATPNDFGRMGQQPTHPELLDWLAADFRDGGQSFKSLHRLILTSATYRQVSVSRPEFEQVDATNQYLWRMSRRKLEAEAIRDAALAVSGKLDRSLYGPAFQDFVIEQPAHSPHYQYHLFHPDDSRAHRRSVYRFLVRSKPQPFMSALDCADPSMQVDKRNETLSPLQALALLNNGFMLTMARHLADRVAAIDTPEGQVGAAFRIALGRDPTALERDTLVTYAKSHGLPNMCRLLFNLNEFIFVD